MNKKSFNLMVIFYLIIHSLLISQSDKDDKANEIINDLMNKTKAVGISVSVGERGKIIWSNGFGYADLEQKVKVDPSKTLFRVGSVAKPITSVAIGLLYQQGLLDLDKEIQFYVPRFPKKKGKITTRLLAGHLAGIRHYKGIEFLSAKKFRTVSEGLKIFENDKLLHLPKTKYAYSSYGWNLISAVIEGASGKSFLSYMEDKVFKPLNMEDTKADHTDRIIENRGRYYMIRDDKVINAPFVDNSYKWAGGGYLSTSEDLVKFGFSFLYPKLLKEETIQELWKSQETFDGKKTNYGMGWSSGIDKSGREWIGHTGGSVGGSTFFRIYPKEELVIVFIANMSRQKLGKSRQELINVFLN